MRADKFFAEHFGSRTKAAQALRAGRVRKGDRAVAPDDEVRDGDIFSVLGEIGEGFVSGGGDKLERGLTVFGERVEGKVFADLGASTGGFTDCLLRRGARKVFCVDVGSTQLDPKIARDPRVTVMDGTNARYLRPEDFPCPLDGVVSDLSFISLRLVLPAVCGLLPEGGSAFLLFKPQFECGKGNVGKSGICPPRLHAALLSDFYDFAVAQGLSPVAMTNAPIRPRKNIEYVLFLKKGGVPSDKNRFLSPLTIFN